MLIIIIKTKSNNLVKNFNNLTFSCDELYIYKIHKL